MSKFQVGDPVRWLGATDEGYCTSGKVYRVLRVEENETAPDDVVFLNDSLEEDKAFERHFELADPHVPDCDGNPIRVGALVESPDRPWSIRRVRTVNPEDGNIFERNMIQFEGGDQGYYGSDGWRVLTADDLHRPPTRDVALRVVVKGVQSAEPNDEVEGWLRKDVFEGGGGLPYQYGDDNITVEVIEDGGNHE